MSQKKFSEFNLIVTPIEETYLAGYQDNQDPNLPNSNIIIKLENLYQSLIDAGNGESLIKTGVGQELSIKKIKGIGSITLTPTGNEIEITVDETQLNLANQDGIVPLSKGGTGANLSTPAQNALLANIGGNSIFINLGTGLTVSGNTLNINIPAILTTKGDLLTRNNSGEIRLPVGLNGQILKADSAEASGLKWENETSLDKTKVTSTSTQDGYLNDLITVQTPILKATVNNNNQLQLGLSVGSIDLSQADNSNSQFITQSFIGTINYDSGWIQVLDGGTITDPGVVTCTNIRNPLIFRIVNKIMFLEGNVYIPLATDTQLGYVDNFNDIPTTIPQTVHTFYGNVVEPLSQRGVTLPRLFPTALSNFPFGTGFTKIRDHYLVRDVALTDGESFVNAPSGNPWGTRIFTPVTVQFNSDSTLTIYGPRNSETTPGNYPITGIGNAYPNIWKRWNVPRFKALDNLIVFDDFYTSIDSNTGLPATDLTGMNHPDSLVWPFDYDGNNADYWGGSTVRLSMVLPLDQNLSLAQIQQFVVDYLAGNT